MDLREALEDVLVIFHRAGATMLVPKKRRATELGVEGSVRELKGVARRRAKIRISTPEKRRVKALSFLGERARRVRDVTPRGGQVKKKASGSGKRAAWMRRFARLEASNAYAVAKKISEARRNFTANNLDQGLLILL